MDRDHWACKKCLVRPACTETCYKGDMFHFLCEHCKTDCDKRISNSGYFRSCEDIRTYEIQKKWAKKMIPIMLEQSLFSKLHLNKEVQWFIK